MTCNVHQYEQPVNTINSILYDVHYCIYNVAQLITGLQNKPTHVD